MNAPTNLNSTASDYNTFTNQTKVNTFKYCTVTLYNREWLDNYYFLYSNITIGNNINLISYN